MTHSGRVLLGLFCAIAACVPSQHRDVHRPAKLTHVERVAVLPFENLTSDLDAGDAAAEAVAEALAATRLTVVASDETQQALKRVSPPPAAAADRLVALRVGQLLKADGVVYGSVTEAVQPGPESVSSASVGLSVRLVEVTSGEVAFAGNYSAPEPRQAARLVAEKVAP